MAISTFQPGLYYFELPGIGYLAYALMSNGPEFLNILSPVVLSDPVCNPGHFEVFAKAFLQQHPTAMFMQVSSTFARVLHASCGLHINSVGGETELDLATFTFSARVWFLNRLPVFAPEPGVRKLVARDKNGQMLAFIFFDAVYEAGKVVGYYANVTRMSPDAHPGVLNLIIKEFIDKVRSENKMAAPAKKVNDSHFTHSKELHNTFNRMFKTGAAFYPFKTLASAKAKYGGGLVNGVYEDKAVTYRPVYLAHSHKNGVKANIALFDFGKLVGFWDHPLDAAAAFAAYQLANKTRKLVLKWKAKGQQPKHQARQQPPQQECGPASSKTEQTANTHPHVKGRQQAAKKLENRGQSVCSMQRQLSAPVLE
eukprot:gene1702-2047_t